MHVAHGIPMLNDVGGLFVTSRCKLDGSENMARSFVLVSYEQIQRILKPALRPARTITDSEYHCLEFCASSFRYGVQILAGLATKYVRRCPPVDKQSNDQAWGI